MNTRHLILLIMTMLSGCWWAPSAQEVELIRAIDAAGCGYNHKRCKIYIDRREESDPTVHLEYFRIVSAGSLRAGEDVDKTFEIAKGRIFRALEELDCTKDGHCGVRVYVVCSNIVYAKVAHPKKQPININTGIDADMLKEE